MVSGCVASVEGKEFVGKIVVVAKITHSQRRNDPLVNFWTIVEKDGNIISAYSLGFKAGVLESFVSTYLLLFLCPFNFLFVRIMA